MLRDLEVLYQRPVPNARIEHLVERKAQQRLVPMPREPRGSSNGLTGALGFRLGWLAVAVAAIAVLAAAAYPAWALVDQALNLTPTGRLVVSEGLGKRVHVARTAQGFTITVERVYADPRGIIVGYSISGPESETFHSFSPFAGPAYKHVELPVLRNDRGHELPGALASLMTGVDSGANGGVLIYDTGRVFPDEHELRLNLTMQAISAAESVGNPGSVRFITIPGPFVFRFRIPYTVRPPAGGWPPWTRAIGEAEGHFARRSARPK